MITLRHYVSLMVVGLSLAGCAFSQGDGGSYSRDAYMAGEEITVEHNQNAYALARQHGVPMRGIIALNDLKPPYNLRAGQRITLPIPTQVTVVHTAVKCARHRPHQPFRLKAPRFIRGLNQLRRMMIV